MLVSLLRSISYRFSLKQPNKIQIKTCLRRGCCFHDYIYWCWLVGAHLEKKMLNLVWPRIEFNFGGLMNQLNLIELQISLEPHTSNWSQIQQWEQNSEQTLKTLNIYFALDRPGGKKVGKYERQFGTLLSFLQNFFSHLLFLSKLLLVFHLLMYNRN